MFEIVERVEQGLLAVADAVLPPSFFFIFVIFVSKSIVFLFVTLILSFPLFVLPHGHKKTQNSMYLSKHEDLIDIQIRYWASIAVN